MGADLRPHVRTHAQTAGRGDAAKARRGEAKGRMTEQTTPATTGAAWNALAAHQKDVAPLHLRELFAKDAARGERMSAEAAGLYLDYSKHRITDETLPLLVALAKACGLRARIDAMFRGDKINVTEQRAALHVALRAPRDASIVVDGRNVVPDVHAVLDRMTDFANRVRSGTWKGHTGKRIRNVINIGIGGSDLGPVMAYEALKHYSDRAMTFRFVSNVDGTDFAEATRDLDPAETLFVISSKTFTTLETMTNAGSARAWALAGLGGDAAAVAQAFRRRVDQRREGVGVRHRHRQHVRILGLGRRALLDGLGDRALDDARGRAGEFPRDAGRLSRDRRALPDRAVRAQSAGADGIARRLEQQFLRRADGRGAAVRAVPEALPRVPAAAHDGEQRQARDAGRRAGRRRHGARSTGASPAPTASIRSIS